MHFFHARFWRIFIIIQLKRSTSMSFKYDIYIEKDEKYWIQVLTLFSFFNAVIFFLLNCQKIKIRGCSLTMLAAHGHIFSIVSEAFIIIIISLWCCLLVQKWRPSVQGQHWNWHTEEGPRRRETRVFSLSYCLSLSLSSLSPSLSPVDHPRLW